MPVATRLVAFTLSAALVVALLPGRPPELPALAAPAAPPPPSLTPEQMGASLHSVRHRPGQAPKYQRLLTYAANLQAGLAPEQARAGKAPPVAALLASGAITHPMAGNSIVLPSEQMIVLTSGGGTAVARSFIDSDAGFHLLGPQYQDQLAGITTARAVAADLDGNGFAELVVAVIDGGCVRVRSYGVTPVNQPRALTGPLIVTPCLDTVTGMAPYHGGALAIAAGGLFDGTDGPNAQQVVVGWEGRSSQSLAVCLTILDGFSLSPVGQQCTPVRSFDPTSQLRGLGLTTGDFNGSGLSQVAYAWVDPQGHLFVNLWQYAPGTTSRVTTPYAITGYQSFAVSLAAGDLDGNGVDELVAATIDGYGTSIFSFWLTTDLSGTTKVTNTANPGGYGGQGANWIAVAVGEFTPPAQGNLRATTGSIVYAVLNPPPSCNPILQHCSCGQPGYPPCTTQAQFGVVFFQNGYPVVFSGLSGVTLDNYLVGQRVSVGAGTLNLDRSDPQRLLSQIVLTGQTYDPNAGTIAITMTAFELTVLPEAPQGAYISQQTSLAFSPPNQPQPATTQVVMGDYLGRSLRLGPPVYHNASNVLQVQALLYEPPQHIDVFGPPSAPVTINVNYNNNPNDLASNGTWVQYQNRQQTTSQNSVQWGNSFQLSLEFSGKVSADGAFVGGSVTTYGGADFEGSQEQFSQVTFGQNVSAVNDTVLIFTEADYDLWEYPVLADGSPTPIGYVTLIFPRKNPLANGRPCLVQCTVSGGIPVVGVARDVTWWNPDHEPGNLLSWLAGVQVSDVMTGIFDSGFKTTAQPNSWFMSWETISSTVSSTSWNVGVDLSVSAGASANIFGTGFEVSTTFSGTYQHQGNTTYRTGFDQSTGLAFNYPSPGYLNAGYQTRSLVYWAKSFPFLWLNWMVDVQPTNFNLWGQYYATNPDPTFILRWRPRYGPITNPAIARLTPDIRFSPEAVQVGQPVTITALIRNYSLAGYVGSTPIPIEFYDGDPASGGTLIGHTTIAGLGSLAVQPVSLSWTPQRAGVHNVFVRIGNVPGTSWIHQDNKLAFAQLAVAARQPAPTVNDAGLQAGGNFGRGRTVAFPERPGHPADLELVPASLVSARNPDGSSQLRVTLQASGGHFANVHVDFYEGTPNHPSRHIAGQVVPLVWQGGTATAQVTWKPRATAGAWPVFARIRSFLGTERSVQNNTLATVILLGPYVRFVPQAPLRSGVSGPALLPQSAPPVSRRRSRRRHRWGATRR
ncbi:MAG: hypothetical protein K6U89_04090 [Chloroflexi bacterium]|nr:hypothetical protein [Chloroflexota bacterium]